ncbi:unnamed protein product [Rotaria socialis]|uniref:Uncharacterized protein n=1 Tax=Rotaria socialis TaxID=392032 RepID=A0A820T130_9BILA|nr:unnamed protein product [Rotaria socialis]CAF3432718.1 unnamed protein product [Rotaria socialis]CAF3507638.1 unnamed protein product [Rotaria socialis]CAF3543526.1 unnamed protein product [Rotaria socialis]CAF3763922.1 unnamed protein product [Rotaria socialis]
MLRIFVFFSIFILVNCATEYSNLNQLIKNEYGFTTTAATTVASTPMAAIYNVQRTDYNRVNKIIKENMEYFIPTVGFLIVAILTIIYQLLKKCYVNDCRCKINWFKVKRPAEYRRRIQNIRHAQIVLNQIYQQPSSMIYSLA